MHIQNRIKVLKKQTVKLFPWSSVRVTCGLVLASPKLSALVLTRLHYHARMRTLVREGYCMLDRYDRMRRQHERSLEQKGLKLKHTWQLKYGFCKLCISTTDRGTLHLLVIHDV